MVVGGPKVPVAVSKTKVRSEFGVRPVLTQRASLAEGGGENAKGRYEQPGSLTAWVHGFIEIYGFKGCERR